MGQNLKNEIDLNELKDKIDLIMKVRIYTIAPETGEPKTSTLVLQIGDETDRRKQGTDDGLRSDEIDGRK